MFGRRKKNPVPNQLQDQSEPNTLSWVEEPGQNEDEEPEVEYADEEADEAEDAAPAEEATPARDERLAGRRAALQAELNRQAEEFGLTRDPTARYGPYGEDVARVLADLAGMDAETAQRLADDWMSADPAERARLETELDRGCRVGKHRLELGAAEDAVASWLDAKLATDPRDQDMWQVIADAATGAVDGLILSDELDDADYGLLYGAWDEIVGGSGKESDDDAEEPDDEGEFGPNTDLVVDMLGRLGNLGPEKLGELSAFWKRQPQEDLRSAHEAVQDLADEQPDAREQIRAAQDEVTSWSNGSGLVPSAGMFGVPSTRVQARIDALPAVADAVTALVMADLLEPADAEKLYAPWAAVVGKPNLPAYEDEPR